MDVGKPIRINRSSSSALRLASTVQGMMSQWTEDNFAHFEETMKLVREGAPVQWLKLYMEAVKLGIDKNTNINININRQKDRDDLQALVRSRVSLPDTGNYTPYEEVRPKALEAEAEPLPTRPFGDDE